MNMWDMATEQALIPKNNLLIVDGLNLAFRYKHRGTSDFAADYVKTINSLAKSYHAREIVVLVDYKGSWYRKDLHPKYKFDRKAKFADQTDEEKLAAEMFFEDFNKAVELCECNFHVIKMEGVEADDTAAYLVEEFEDGEVFDHIWMISTDRDWDELLGETVSRFSYTTRKEYTIENFYEHHQCDDPEQYTSIKAIMGDPGDSVYGVGGIGAKRAYNLVRQYGDALDLATQLPIEGKQKYIIELNKSEEKLILNTQLVDLRSFHKEAIAFPSPENLLWLERICKELRGEL
ncbi:flap endonuclease [Vibrio phage Chloris]|uniref:Flap endonuclease n=4 Tax=Thalassavirus TaxID=2948922 RepID=A0A4Y6EBI9_9CAUD|nr:flap endonuclease [Vibrio phage Thalassa]YP_010101816.1 flap endonuclease [Vibrio phage Achelous]YP_010102472.1 flap endonuclease [Vibrio phage Brizo]YP_010102661.1 flap endonuclease [Vibrio phage Pontus]WBU76469.1 flap endonuclease [Vibrio phage Chloris]AUG85243.1 flap endonuclease [Vibrio phage Thalassa]QCQ57634.1 flap endonuclease [Vibrio phage Achelous]QDF14450.1 flap endonuclease [Vibrio phage Brizo]QDF14689.1 flap endonuclease [Vibrio phage Pontus]